MKIIISVQNYLSFPSGVKKFIEKYYTSLKEEFNIITRKNFKAPYFIDGKEINDINEAIKKTNARICHIHSVLDASVYSGLIGFLKEKRIPTIYFCHSLLKEELEDEEDKNPFHIEKFAAQKELFDKVDHIVFFNEYHRKMAIEEQPRLSQKSLVIYQGVKKTEIRKYKKSKKIILFVGRLSKEKGILDLVDAYKLLEKKRKDISLIIVGDISISRLTEKIKNELKDSNVQLVDWIDDEKKLAEYYQKASVVVIPSHYDSFNLVGIEALSNGIPVLVSDIPVFRELYVDTGLANSFKSKDILSLSKELKKALAMPKKPKSLPEKFTFGYFMSKIEQLNKEIKSV